MPTPNSLATTGHSVDDVRLDSMSTDELLAYFCEVRKYKAVYEDEEERIKAKALARKDLPKKFNHPDPAFGGCSQKGVGGKWIINAASVLRHIGNDFFMKVAKVGKTDLEEVATPLQWNAMLADNTIQGGEKGVTLQYDKP